MKPFRLLFLLFFVFFQCTQKQSAFDDQVALLGALVSIGAPKSFGLNMLIDNRINRACETRIGNFGADAYRDRGKAQIGFFSGGTIRQDFGILTTYPTGVIPKGTIPTFALMKQFLPFQGGNFLKVNLSAYRIKQALEVGMSRLNNSAERDIDGVDSDGPIHGNCWLNPQPSGSGRFLHVSSNIHIEVNPTATALVTSGSSSTNNLLVATEGNRIVKLSIDGILLYNNPTGSITSGWSAGSSTCTIKGTTFTNSAACTFFSASVEKFQFDGSDFNPSLNPIMSEINNDGSVVVLEAGIAAALDDAGILFEYIQTFTTGPVFPKISNRILMP